MGIRRSCVAERTPREVRRGGGRECFEAVQGAPPDAAPFAITKPCCLASTGRWRAGSVIAAERACELANRPTPQGGDFATDVSGSRRKTSGIGRGRGWISDVSIAMALGAAA